MLALAAVVSLIGSQLAAQESTGESLELSRPVEVEPVLGYGLSVFRGQEPERFEVEILGNMAGVTVGDDYILAKLSGAGLEKTGVIAGMSGSPVYVDGELIGAVAFAWPFAHEAIGGITPIGSMRQQLLAPNSEASRRPMVAWDGVFDLSNPEDRLRQWASRLTPTVVDPGQVQPGQVSLQLAASGMSSLARSWFAGPVADLAPAPGAQVDRPLTPGSAVAGILVDGDWKLSVTGTVTEVEGDRVLAFGHPFLANGPTDLPMAPAEIVTVVSSRMSSFKVSNFGEPVGRFDSDRSTGVGGQIGELAAMIPVSIRHRSLADPDSDPDSGLETYSMRMARIPEMLPLLVGLGVFETIGASGHQAGTYGLDLVARFDLGGYGDLVLDSTYDGASAGLQGALQLIQYVDLLHNNPWADVEVKAIELEVTQHPRPMSLEVVEASVDRSTVHAGESITGRMRLRGYRQQDRELPFTIQLPRDVGPGSYHLLIGNGREIDFAEWSVTGATPQTFEQALRLLRNLRSSRTFAVSGLRATRGLSVGGVALPGLPASVAEVLHSGRTTKPVPWRIESLLEENFDQPLNGVVRIDLEVVADNGSTR